MSAGQIAEVFTAETALYAESGGQVADKGVIVGPGYELEVLDVQKPVPGLISHTVEVTTGEAAVGLPATTVVDAAWSPRRSAMRVDPSWVNSAMSPSSVGTPVASSIARSMVSAA